MKVISLSTAEQGCSMAFINNNDLVYETYWDSKQTHSKRLMMMIEHMLEKRVGILLEDVDAFVAAKGPGSFTGLRIGISVVKGLASALSKPEVGISSLDGIAWRFYHSDVPVCAMMDAKRKEVYCALYRFQDGDLAEKSDEMVFSPENAIDMAGERILFVGSGARAYKALIEDRTNGQALFADNFENHVSASALVRALYSKENGLNLSENFLNPTYIRKSDAELQFAKKHQA
ncbi:MAG: tRNA (adenosine(37)-N6)-threonylcarbamoyltransferase complex dimerization subunit type 1 TsaB [Desulfobacteraceae bacterium]|nr:tRNA (adenosine(37)-N6)-threonylcarbamoyltransferase complex dimerization subunit type 1 TsaB [Desulfobacteraceae bacterium]